MLDKRVPDGSAAVTMFSCALCEGRPCFATSRALQSHQRTKHNQRNPVRCFLFGSRCPVCKTDFIDRLRCLAHLSDSRRERCRIALTSGAFPRVPDQLLIQLDAQDNELRKAVRKKGRSHHIATLPALKPNGRIIGRVTATSYT